MELDIKLNFTEICRCCKRTTFGMTSIFDGSVHSTYPPLRDMLKTIASLNIHENDGLPSLVCTSCIDNIQDAYTFILHLILVDEELWQILLARGKQIDTQATYDSNQCLSNESVKKENESEAAQTGANSYNDDVNLSLIVEDLDEPMQNVYQHGSANSSYENINFVVKAVDVPVPENGEGNQFLLLNEQTKSLHSVQSLTEITREDIQLNHQKHGSEWNRNVGESKAASLEQGPDAAEKKNDLISPKLRAKRQKSTSNLDDVLHHTPVEREESSPALSLTLQELLDPETTRKPLIYTGDDEFEDEDDMEADKDYQEDDDDVHSTDSSDYDYTTNGNRKKARKSSGRTPGRSREMKTTTSLTAISKIREDIDQSNSLTAVVDNTNGSTHSTAVADASVFKCNVCGYTNSRLPSLKHHLLSHFKNKPFACPKCNRTFAFKCGLQTHVRNFCKGEIGKESNYKKRNGKQVISLTLQDLKDPVKLQKYYTVTDDVKELTVFKCTQCAYTGTNKANFIRHLQTHSNQSFACSKCNDRFPTEGYMLRHRPFCNGDMDKENASKPVELSTLENLKDPGDVVAMSTDDLEDVDDIGADVDYVEEDGSSVESSDCDYTPNGIGKKKRARRSSGRGSRKPSRVKTRSSLNASSRTREDISQSSSHTTVDGEVDAHGKSVENVAESEVENEEISPNMRAVTLVYKCKLCAYTTAQMFGFKKHLQSHFKDKQFACSKCNGRFSTKDNLARHWGICKGEISKHACYKGPARKQVISMTLQDLKDPEKIKNYYTVAEIDMQNIDDDDLKAQAAVDDDIDNEENCPKPPTKRRQTTTTIAVFKCKLCAYTTAKANTLRLHLHSHSTDRPFTCSKCSGTFASKRRMLGHSSTCNGKGPRNYRYMGDASKKVISLTQQELKDPLKRKQYYTLTEIEVRNKDDERTNQPGTSSNLAPAYELLKCTLCLNTSLNMADFIQHLRKHIKDRPKQFACPKCNRSFTQRSNMLVHKRKCKNVAKIIGAICPNSITYPTEKKLKIHNLKYHDHAPSKQDISLTLDDLRDPEKLKTYYTVQKFG